MRPAAPRPMRLPLPLGYRLLSRLLWVCDTVGDWAERRRGRLIEQRAIRQSVDTLIREVSCTRS